MLTLLLKNQAHKKSVVTIELENKSSESVLISKDSLLLDGFTSNKFNIIDKNTGFNVPYEGRFVKYKPDSIELSKFEKITSNIDLEQVYNLEECHQYNVSFETILIIGDEIIRLSGLTDIEMECNS